MTAGAVGGGGALTPAGSFFANTNTFASPPPSPTISESSGMAVATQTLSATDGSPAGLSSGSDGATPATLTFPLNPANSVPVDSDLAAAGAALATAVAGVAAAAAGSAAGAEAPAVV